jgi:hypothetical protein
MTTYSNSLKLSLIGDGEQTGVWGATTNTNLGTLLEQAICYQTSITMSAGSDYTLTNLNGAADESRSAAIIIGGVQSGTNAVICPAKQKLYIITNNLASSATAYFKPAGGTALAIITGTTVIAYCTGSTMVAVNYVDSSYSSLLAAGAANLTGGSANTLVYQSATGSTAYLTPGTAGYVLTSGGSGAIPYWNPAGTATLASNIAGGGAGQMVYQSGPNTTNFVSAGSTGQLLQSNGTGAPSWTTFTGANTSAVNIWTNNNTWNAGYTQTFNGPATFTSGTATTFTTAPTVGGSALATLGGNNTWTGANSFTNPSGTGTAIKGVTDGSSAAPGYVGEVISATASAVPAPNNVATNVAQISLSAGDWDIWGSTDCNNNPNIVAYLSSISTTSATIQTSGGIYLNGGGTMGPLAQPAPQATVNFSGANRTYYLVVFAAYTGTTAAVNGQIYARRMR